MKSSGEGFYFDFSSLVVLGFFFKMVLQRSNEDLPTALASEENGPKCGVCNATVPDKSVLTETVCRHLFHKTCVSNHIKTNPNCPVCGKKITRDPTPSAPKPASSPVATRSSSKAKNFDSMRSTDLVPSTSSQSGNATNVSQGKPSNTSSSTTLGMSEFSLNDIQSMVSRIVSEQQSQLLSALSSQISTLVDKSVETSLSRLGSNAFQMGHIQSNPPQLNRVDINSSHALNTSSPDANRAPRMHTLPDVEQRTLEQLLGLPSSSNNRPNVSGGQDSFDARLGTNRPYSAGSVTVPDLCIRPDKVSQIMFNWKMKFNGSSNCLPVDSFIYRVEALTNQTLGGNFHLLCGNASALFDGKANDWFWRFHKTVDIVKWPDLCRALREQYKDSRTDVDIREMIRDRKQKSHESFDSFYESVIDLVDRLEQPLSGKTLVEILRRNLLPEIQHEILNMKIESIGQLREICRRREFFIQDVYKRHGVSGSKVGHLQKRLSEIDIEPEQTPVLELLPPDEDIAEISLICWNCRGAGHRYQDCLAERTIFCYGCGAPQTYKPSCRKCSSNPKNYSAMAPKGAAKTSHAQTSPETK